MHIPVEGRVVIITGASRGIGRATALELAGHGARLALTARHMPDLEETVRAAQELGAEARGYWCDLRDPHAVEETVTAICRDFGRVDVLINNAAVGKYGSFLSLTQEDWQTLVETNLLGLVAMTRAVLPTMLGGGGGHIVNVASIQGIQATPTSSAYSATKFALMGLTQSLQLEFRHQGVRVTALCPGSVETDFDGFPGSLKTNPLLPEDVAIAIREVVETGGRAYVAETILMPLFAP